MLEGIPDTQSLTRRLEKPAKDPGNPIPDLPAEAGGPLRGAHGVRHQHGDGHRADAAGHRGDPAGHFLRRIEIHVAAQLAVGHAVDADVDHRRAGLDHVAGDHLRPAGGDDQDVGVARVFGEVDGLGGADGDGGIVLQQHQRHRLADDVAAPDHHGMLALDRHAAFFQQLHRAVRRAGGEAHIAGGQRADVHRVEAVHVLVRADRFEHLAAVDVFWHRQLHEDAVDLGVGVQFGDLRQQRGFRRVGRHDDVFGMQAQLRAGLHLVGDVHLGGGVFADDDDRQPRRDAARLKRIGAFLPLGAYLLGDGFAVDDLCCHDSLPLLDALYAGKNLVPVPLDAVHDFRMGRVYPLPTLDLDPLARFQRLVELKEMFDLFQRDFRQILIRQDFMVQRGQFVGGHGDDLGIAAAFILHAQHADRTAGDDSTMNDGEWGDHQHIHRVAVVRDGFRDEAVVARITHQRSDEAIHHQYAGLLVHFVLYRVGMFGDFDDDIALMRGLVA